MDSTRDTFWQRLHWPLLSTLLTIALAASRVLINPRFYFTDDTERGSFGQWWALGEYLSRGELPILDPSAWQGGNYFAEGQWGILSPITWLIGLTAYAAPDAAVHVTIWKIAFLAVFSIGMYLLATQFGSSRPWAALVAVLAPAAGFTVYMDAASWSTGLFDACLFPLVWWALRRAVEYGKSPWPYVLASFTLITIGYVFGVIVLVVVLVATLVEHIVRRDRIRILRTLAASAWGALWTLVIYLPAMATSAVTTRSEAPYENTGFLNADVADLFTTASPLTTGSIYSWNGYTDGPLMYIAWILPLFPLFLPIARARTLVPVFVLGSAMLAFVLGPSDLGAIRWPIRMMPYVVIAVLVVFAVAATRAYPERITRAKVWWSFGLIVAMAYITWVAEMWSWKSILVAAALQTVALAAFSFTGSASANYVAGRAPRWQRQTNLVVVASLVVTLGVGGVQMLQWRESPLPGVDAPTSTSALESVLEDASGDAIVVGDYMKGATDPESWDERLMANLWYLSDTNVSSVYTVLPFSAYATDLCSDLRGVTCDDALDVLWSVDSETGLPVADLLDVSTIIAAKKTFPSQPVAPDGWHLAEDGDYTWRFDRDEPLPSAGGVTWTGEGTLIADETVSDTSVSFTVTSVGSDPRVTLSRLPFPGYSVSGATLTDPVRDYLLTVSLADASVGDTVTVTFLPPPFPVLVASFVGAWLVLLAWLIARAAARRATRRSAPAPAPASVAGDA
ncbi:hypothetical protein GCM10010922_27160 [Microbacterium sorbitolivorans]|uniref:Uncharacterized protein n=1 Tax=Microbacterium sorbitolivorans TaxID=1867410 RepID=A0A367XTF6_9MICO|nr:hypothetical protein [Microbacterium sorbitolivorans]RCK56916.1 hypothetical protein DTO57_13635 [Microbacterium sorbitolivorans]GGF49783.1 hypothetical protein GCM10010922_27160 [Microbacterium sorbitolivorans]